MGQSHIIHIVDSLTNIHFVITHDVFEVAMKAMKAQCIAACDLSIIELEHRFLNHELMNSLRVIFPQY
jgi:hypothetical protein